MWFGTAGEVVGGGLVKAGMMGLCGRAFGGALLIK